MTQEDERKEMKRMIDERIKSAGNALSGAKDMLQERQKGFEDSVAGKPYHWVAGAFVAGLLLGKLMSRERD
jgi:ElaB/YqjD/DUF883 family membrane-anchored ribosome-binding protein